jgi:hypothetical protein
MKNGLQHIVGKRISAVVVARGKESTTDQVFLVFPDGSRFEFYGRDFSCCSALDKAEGIDEYVADGGGEIRAIYDEDSPESLAGRMKRDLEAWRLAKAAIAKAAKPK